MTFPTTILIASAARLLSGIPSVTGHGLRPPGPVPGAPSPTPEGTQSAAGATSPAASPTPSPEPTVTALMPTTPAVPEFSRTWPEWAQWWVGLPLKILLTIAVGLLVLALLRTIIRRWSQSIADGVPWSQRSHWGRRLARTTVGSVLSDASPLDSSRRAQRARTIGSVLRSTTTGVIGLITVVMVMDDLGVPIGPLLASAGIVGVAVGFGAQSLVKDILSGMFMLMEDQYGVGDVIDVGEATGTVEAVGLRVTKIRDTSGTLWFVPNGTIVRVGNQTQGWAQVLVDVRLPYRQDVEAAQGVMLEVARDMAAEKDYQGVFLNAPDIQGIEDLAAGSVLVRLRVRTVPTEQWAVGRELRQRIHDRFAAQDIEMAAPVPVVPPQA